MSKPKGEVLFGNDITIVLNFPTVVLVCRCNNIPRSSWYDCINIPVFVWDAGLGRLSYTIPIGFPQYSSATLQLWWTLDGEDINGWTRFSDDDWVIEFTEIEVIFSAVIGDKMPVNGDFFMILMDGPSAPQGLSPKVIGVTPV